MTNEPTNRTVSEKRRRPRRWLVVLTAVLLFVCGCATGAGGMSLLMKHRIQRAFKSQGAFAERASMFLTRRLSLDKEQAEAVRVRFEQQHKRIQQRQLEIRSSMQQFEADVAAILKPDQQAQWKEHCAKMRKMLLPLIPPPISSPAETPAGNPSE